MKQHAKRALNHPLVRGSAIVVVGNLLANVFNFLFNLFMSRSLTVTDYGVLASIITLITFPALLTNAVNPVVVRFAGDYFAKGELGLVRGLYIKFAKFFFIVGIIVFTVFFFSIPAIAHFFHIDDHMLLHMVNIIVFLSVIGIINIAFLQAKLAFGYTVFIAFMSALVKFVLGVLFVYLGYAVFGAVGALVITGIVVYALGLFPLRFIFSKKFEKPHIDTKEIFKYGIPSALTLIGLTSYISADILLTKHFFSPDQAGLYAGLSLVGRIIFYLTVPISSVMFPILVRKHATNEPIQNTLLLAVFFVLAPASVLTLAYFIMPEFVILFFLKKTEYLSVAPYLGYFGLYITLYCFVYLAATFYLSIKKTIIYFPILIAAFLQAALIYVYHESFTQVITISFVLILLLAIGFLLYYPYATKK